MAIIVILCGAPHLYKKDMNNSGLIILKDAMVRGVQTQKWVCSGRSRGCSAIFIS